MAFSNTIKCPDCGTIYYKGQGHVCPVPCEDCGVKIYSETHSCDPKRVEEILVKKAWQQMDGQSKGPIDHEAMMSGLTPRLQASVDNWLGFYRWCRENNRP